MTLAKDIMTTDLILAHPDMTIDDAIKTFVNNRITGMPVVDINRKLVGVVSEYDVIKSVNATNSEFQINLGGKINFSTKASTVTEDTPLQDILRLFIEKNIRRVPVMNKNDELVGIITRRDIMRIMYYRSKSS